MSEEKRWNEEQWDDLPLPGSDASWEKMQLLLDEEEKRRRVVPFWFWRYALTGLLLTGVAIGGWLWTHSDKEKENLSTGTGQKTEDRRVAEKTPHHTLGEKQDQTHTNKTSQPGETGNTSQPKNGETAVGTQPSTKMATTVVSGRGVKRKKDQKPVTASSTSQIPAARSLKNNSVSETPASKETPVLQEKQKLVDTSSFHTPVAQKNSPAQDTVKKIASSPVDDKENQQQKKRSSASIIWSAGIGLQQAIAVNGQQSSPYNYKGNQSSLSDHIPSVYLRLQKEKWFAQIEFQYAVPHPVEQFSFSQKTSYDPSNMNVNRERFIIQKLYYHLIPVSVNYTVLPNFSVGAGGTYNILAGAVTEQEITSKNAQTGNETVSRNLSPVQGYKDSFLYKTTAGILLQTDYQWKRFSLGLRFTQNLQPFIKYTTPDGAVVSEKNQAFQAILRFRLWNSK